MPDNQLFSTKAAAAYLGLQPVTLEKWRYERKQLPFVTVSPSCVRYRKADLDQWIEGNIKSPDGNQAA